MAAAYLIVGAGRFGQLAWRRLQAQDPEARFLLVDQDPQKLARLPVEANTRIMRASGPAAVAAILAEETWPDWLIPAIPVHLAFAWLLLTPPAGETWLPLPVPAELGQGLPFRQQGPEGEVYLSLATGLCPDDCPEPARRCGLTGAPRLGNLFEMLARQQIRDYKTLVLRSRQLAPGVGGYRPAELWRLREKVVQAGKRLIVCTACRCHGVCHGLERLIGRESEVGI